MKSQRMLCLVMMVVLLVPGIVANTLAGGKSSLEEADDYMKGGQYQDAIAVLKEKLSTSPKNAKAHLLLGACYINTGNVDAADSEFERAVGLQPNLAKRVGEEQIKAGSRHLENGRLDEANRCFTKAIIRNQKLRTTIAEKWFNASSAFFPWKPDAVHKCLAQALAMDYSGMKERVTGQYYALSRQSDEAIGLTMLIRANDASGGKYKNEISVKALRLCNNKESPTERGSCINSFSRYLSKEEIFDSSVGFFTKLWGPPQILELNVEEWKKADPSPKVGETIYYLSLNDFLICDDDNQPIKWQAAYSDYFSHRLMSISGSLRLKRADKNTTVYAWIRR